ncbi:MAG: hypothetical protein GY729_14950, partial [Desulfobacteraceae bacterium]|nr:hypothetical protein [Desulfobacteraceae bacterium]
MTTGQSFTPHVTSIFTAPMIVLFTLIFLFISLLNNQTQMTILLLLILGLVAGTKLWSRLAISKMKFQFEIDKHRVFPGEGITLKIKVENPKILPVRLQVNVLVDESQFGLDTPVMKNTFLLWFQKTELTWHLNALHRGCFNFGHPQVTISDLFGFFPRGIPKKKSVDVVVYPKIISIKPFSMPDRNFFGMPGAKSPVQDPVYVLGTREY